MVGVARSQACRNCKRKKKGCDLTRPSCGQCARLGLSCGYDEKKWTFINNGDLGAYSQHSPPPHFRTSKPIELDFAQALTVTSLPRGLRRSSLATQLEETFWAAYLPRDDFLSCQYIGGITDTPWIPAIRLIAGQDDLARSAVDALSLTALGSLHDDMSLTHEGARIYAKVLQGLNTALQDPTRAQSDGVVAACGMLSAYEIFRKERDVPISSASTDWKRHIAGACQIVHMRGAKRHASKTGHALFLQARKLAIISSLCNKKPTLLFETDEWRSVPWENSPKTLRDELWDIMALVPTLLQQQDIFLRTLSASKAGDCSQALAEGRTILENCINVANLFQAWEQKTIRLAKESDASRGRRDSPFDFDLDAANIDPQLFGPDHTKSTPLSNPADIFGSVNMLPADMFHSKPSYSSANSRFMKAPSPFLHASSPFISPPTPPSPPASNAGMETTLNDVCRDHGFSFFQACSQYWYTTVPFYARTHLLYRRLCHAIYLSTSPQPTADVDTLPSPSKSMDHASAASHLANNFEHYFRPEAGLWGVSHATLSCTMILMYYAAFDGQNSPECLRVKHLLATDKKAALTGDFVRSNLVDSTIDHVHGDGRDPEALRRMAVSWFEGSDNESIVSLADSLGLPPPSKPPSQPQLLPHQQPSFGAATLTSQSESRSSMNLSTMSAPQSKTLRTSMEIILADLNMSDALDQPFRPSPYDLETTHLNPPAIRHTTSAAGALPEGPETSQYQPQPRVLEFAF